MFHQLLGSVAKSCNYFPDSSLKTFGLALYPVVQSLKKTFLKNCVEKI
ncbi:hypothetical protein Hamer_G009690 [Homarus americanus]|uniref:Uncharacterized protein n=1 Tax=Homarus americanus TaxID=6706 RepID=A0A8J5N354_HOMAM|nr:hypothetical protein Hamer_G009690 [Homarus americanus]